MNGINNIRFGSFYVLPDRAKIKEKHGNDFICDMGKVIEKTAKIDNFLQEVDISSTDSSRSDYTLYSRNDERMDSHIESYLTQKVIKYEKYAKMSDYYKQFK